MDEDALNATIVHKVNNSSLLPSTAKLYLYDFMETMQQNSSAEMNSDDHHNMHLEQRESCVNDYNHMDEVNDGVNGSSKGARVMMTIPAQSGIECETSFKGSNDNEFVPDKTNSTARSSSLDVMLDSSNSTSSSSSINHEEGRGSSNNVEAMNVDGNTDASSADELPENFHDITLEQLERMEVMEVDYTRWNLKKDESCVYQVQYTRAE